MELLNSNPEEAIKSAFFRCETNFLEWAYKEQLEDGSTVLKSHLYSTVATRYNQFTSQGVVALIKGNMLYVGNVGDSEATVCRAGKAINMTVLHNPAKNPTELQRVEQAGGRIVRSRVGHPHFNANYFNIAVSRAM